MKKSRKGRIIASILIIGTYIHADSFQADLARYYGSGQGSPRSYIDTNSQISMESYTHANPYPNNYPGGDGTTYNDSKSSQQKYFQPADGSLNNGIYNVINKTAKTPLHSYTNVITIDGTVTTPKLNSKGQYVDKQGKEYTMIGSLQVRSEDESDTFIYYLFGQLADPTKEDTQTSKQANIPMKDFHSQDE